MPGVIDFVVLKQHYDQAVQGRPFAEGDRVQAAIDDHWYYGSVQGDAPLDPAHPDSLFQRFMVLWDTEESERMSPWDMQHTKGMPMHEVFSCFCFHPFRLSSLLNYACLQCVPRREQACR